jgi:hypothetical protein
MITGPRTLLQALLAGVVASASGSPGVDAGLTNFRWVRPLTGLLPFDAPVRDLWFVTPSRLLATTLSRGAEGRQRVWAGPQRVRGVRVRGTWVERVWDASGNLAFQTGAVATWPVDDLAARVPALAIRERAYLEMFRRRYPEWADPTRWVTAPHFEIVLPPGQPARFEWVIETFAPDETRVRRWAFDEDERLIVSQPVGFAFAEGRAVAYPKGPKESLLQEVPLENLDGSGTLSSARLQARSAAGIEVSSDRHEFLYGAQDPRFDQVQAYVYADEFLSWAGRRLGVDPSGPLEVKVQVGERSNAAFYYGHRVRIGDGDGARYREMARDPSIVMHEVAHFLIDGTAHLPSEGEGGGLNEGFADYLATTYLGNPRVGEVASVSEPFTRTLENPLTTAEGFGGDLYAAARVVGGTLWDVRTRLGAEIADLLALRTLLQLGPSARYVDFPRAVHAAAKNWLPPDQMRQVRDALSARGWNLADWDTAGAAR